jgi:colicin import membrane protein
MPGSENSLDLFINLVADLSGGKMTQEELQLLRESFAKLDVGAQTALGSAGRMGMGARMAFSNAQQGAEGLASVFGSGPLGPAALDQVARAVVGIAMTMGSAMTAGIATVLATLLAGIGTALSLHERALAKVKQELDQLNESYRTAKQSLQDLQDTTDAGELPSKRTLQKDIEDQQDALDKAKQELFNAQHRQAELEKSGFGSAQRAELPRVEAEVKGWQANVDALQEKINQLQGVHTSEDASAITESADRDAKIRERVISNAQDEQRRRQQEIEADSTTSPEQKQERIAALDLATFQKLQAEKLTLEKIYFDASIALGAIHADKLAQTMKERAVEAIVVIAKLNQDHLSTQTVAEEKAAGDRAKAEAEAKKKAEKDLEASETATDREERAEASDEKADDAAAAKSSREAIDLATQHLKGEGARNIGAVPKAMLEELGKALKAGDIDAISGFNNDILKLLQSLTQQAEAAQQHREQTRGHIRDLQRRVDSLDRHVAAIDTRRTPS